MLADIMRQIEDTWTIIDQEQEFESAVSSLHGMELGRSLLMDADNVDPVSQEENSLSHGSGSSYSSAVSNSHSSVTSAYMEHVAELVESEALHSQEQSVLKQQMARMMEDMSSSSQENMQTVTSLQEERSLLAKDRELLTEELARMREYMSKLMHDQSVLQQEKEQLEADRLAVHAAQSLTEQELEAMRRERCAERDAFQAERAAFAADRDAFMAERNHLNKDIDSIRRERQYWQTKCMESAQGSRGTEGVLVAAITSLRRRLQNLAREARQCRLMEEGGGSLQSFPDTSENDTDQSEESMQLGSVETSMEDAEAALSDLENEFIPLISRWLSLATSQHGTGPLPSPSAAPKISLSSFEENDLALFFPTPRGDYLAFNAGAPHHYLSAESKALIGMSPPPRPIAHPHMS